MESNGHHDHGSHADEHSPVSRQGLSVNFGLLFIGIVLVLIGVGTLADDFGLLEFNALVLRTHIVPLLVIALGLSILPRRGGAAVVIGTLVTVGALLVLVLILFGSDIRFNFPLDYSA